MIYSRVIEYSGRKLLPQNDKNVCYYLRVFVGSFMEQDENGAVALFKRETYSELFREMMNLQGL